MIHLERKELSTEEMKKYLETIPKGTVITHYEETKSSIIIYHYLPEEETEKKCIPKD